MPTNKAPTTKTIVMRRNAKNGELVTEAYAKKNPATTVVENRKVQVKPRKA